MRQLMLLAVVTMWMLSSTVAAQTNRPTRPAVQYEFPQAVEFEINGVDYKCFAKDGSAWRTVGHIVVDYRGFFPWATWADAELMKIEILRGQRAIWESLTQSTQRTLEITEAAYAEERKLRVDLQRERRLLPWLMGGGIALETIIIVGLSIWGAAQ